MRDGSPCRGPDPGTATCPTRLPDQRRHAAAVAPRAVCYNGRANFPERSIDPSMRTIYRLMRESAESRGRQEADESRRILGSPWRIGPSARTATSGVSAPSGLGRRRLAGRHRRQGAIRTVVLLGRSLALNHRHRRRGRTDHRMHRRRWRIRDNPGPDEPRHSRHSRGRHRHASHLRLVATRHDVHRRLGNVNVRLAIVSRSVPPSG